MSTKEKTHTSPSVPPVPYTDALVGLDQFKLGIPSQDSYETDANFWIVTYAKQSATLPDGSVNSGRGYTTALALVKHSVYWKDWSAQGYKLDLASELKPLVAKMDEHPEWFGKWRPMDSSVKAELGELDGKTGQDAVGSNIEGASLNLWKAWSRDRVGGKSMIATMMNGMLHMNHCSEPEIYTSIWDEYPEPEEPEETKGSGKRGESGY
ncbi:hypothetical protein BKA66DRAFT_477721 [Pyrenochaeta sp. MPI-SDFR-AT-0127]|nr:hypothetical protein BKA66DRAFT_477721 [Pyrenochaeta sp. MPI-SDFR-AT-0127]